MAGKSLRLRRMGRTRRLRKVLLITVGLVAVPLVAEATYAVLDTTAVAKAVEQIKELKKQVQAQLDILNEAKQQVSFLNDISGFMSEVKDATGKVGSMSIPVPNLEKMTAQTKGNLRCLMPDASAMKWGIKFEDLNMSSICDTSSKYRSALFLDHEKSKGMSYAQLHQERTKAALNRSAMLEDATLRALAHADVQLKQSDELNEAADKLQGNLAAAQTLQDRSHVQAQIQIAGLRGQAQQTQLLAQLLKVQTLVAINLGLPADKVAEVSQEGKQ